MKKYKVTIYFVNNSNLQLEMENDVTKEELADYYQKILESNEPFKGCCNNKNCCHIIRPEAVTMINIELIK